MFNKFLFLVLKILSFITLFIITLFLTVSFISFVLKIFDVLPANTILSDLSNIDYHLFMVLCLLTFITTFTVAIILAKISLLVFKSEDIEENVLRSSLKFSGAITIIVPMIFTLTKEQFNVATTFISFVALFSFVIPKKENYINKNRDKYKNE